LKMSNVSKLGGRRGAEVKPANEKERGQFSKERRRKFLEKRPEEDCCRGHANATSCGLAGEGEFGRTPVFPSTTGGTRII